MGDLVVHHELDACGHAGELLQGLADRLLALVRRIDRHVLVDGIVGEEADQLVHVLVGPGGDETVDDGGGTHGGNLREGKAWMLHQLDRTPGELGVSVHNDHAS